MTDTTSDIIADNSIDDHVDEEIKNCVKSKKNFFMFAGAGSGKTSSLVNTLKFIAAEYGSILSLRQKHVAVITYTNAACDEICNRIGYNSLFAVSTIHSFLWELIKPYQRDIKTWVKRVLEVKISELQQKQAKARTKDYSGDIKKKQDRLMSLECITRFTYNPSGENVGRDSLDHSEVISMGSDFIRERATMQDVLVSKFPILLIDESQDTKKELVDALLAVELKDNDDFIIGMFGDMMQRIYPDGKDNLANIIPNNWERPAKVMNHRSTHRVIRLANAIRNTIDGQKQQPRSDKHMGFVRLFVASSTSDKESVETQVYTEMAKVTGDVLWNEPKQRKTLVLEHSMAASRLGFGKLNDDFKGFEQSFRDGTLTELAFLMKVVYPLVTANREQNNFAIMNILRKHSPLLKVQKLQTAGNQILLLREINKRVDSLEKLWHEGNIPTCIDIYRNLFKTGLFELPKRIEEILSDEVEVSERIAALREGLNTSFDELEKYWNYVNDNTQISTHQGIKGLEFERVAVIMDDESAGGFLFSYDKLFGAKPLSDTDRKNEREGKDTTLLRTMRLFYVTCTRAKESLALIAYTNDTDSVHRTALENSWFYDDEVKII